MVTLSAFPSQKMAIAIGNVTKVYVQTKYLIEEMLMDLSCSDEVRILFSFYVFTYSNEIFFFPYSAEISVLYHISILLGLILLLAESARIP
jgi:hypothetical protein